MDFLKNVLLLIVCGMFGGGCASEKPLVLLCTTSVENSGLLDHLLPKFSAESGIHVVSIPRGTGQTLRAGMNGDGDVLLVHDREREERFVREGYGAFRVDVMYNNFVVVGPSEDPAELHKALDVFSAFRLIADSGSNFVSRGDDSGTHKRELALWRKAGPDPTLASGDWYREVGKGMGAALNSTVAMKAYTLTDRGTWISYRGKRDFEILYQGGQDLYNPYGAILVSSERYPGTKSAQGRIFVEWLTSSRGQRAVEQYKIGGEQLFFPMPAFDRKTD